VNFFVGGLVTVGAELIPNRAGETPALH